MSRTLEGRLKLIIADLESDTYGRWKRLETSTGISATRWKNVSQGSQRPAPDMIEAIAQLAPQYAFWLATGVSDPQHGHIAPGDEGYPSTGHEQTNSTRYFQELIAEKKLATAVSRSWFEEEQLPIREDETICDEMVRNVISILRFPGNETSIDTTKLNDQKSKTLLASKLRYAEIAMHDDMPDFDFDETEHVLNAVERILGDLSKAEGEMPEGTKIVTDKLNGLKARIESHKNHPRTLERLKKLRQQKK